MALIDLYSKEQLKTIVKESKSIKEVARKLGYNAQSGRNPDIIKKRIKEYEIDTSHFTYVKGIKRTPENVFIENSTASQKVLREQYKKIKTIPYECSICGMSAEQQGKPLTLILDHINGNNKDDRLENLRQACPNCNQQLDTTGYRNPYAKQKRASILSEKRKEKVTCPICGSNKSPSATKCWSCLKNERKSTIKPSREVLKDLIRTTGFMEIGNRYGVTDRAVAKWCKSENLPSTRKEIKSYSDEEQERL